MYIPLNGWQVIIEQIVLIKKARSAICSNMDGPRDYHNKWNKSDRERQIAYVAICISLYCLHVKSREDDTNEFIYKPERG